MPFPIGNQACFALDHLSLAKKVWKFLISCTFLIVSISFDRLWDPQLEKCQKPFGILSWKKLHKKLRFKFLQRNIKFYYSSNQQTFHDWKYSIYVCMLVSYNSQTTYSDDLIFESCRKILFGSYRFRSRLDRWFGSFRKNLKLNIFLQEMSFFYKIQDFKI